MAQPAPGREPSTTPNETINITLVNGTLTPSLDPASIPIGGSVQFVNLSSVGVAVELFTHENNHHVAVSVYIPPSGQGNNTVVLCNDPQHSNSICYYNLVTYPPSDDNPGDSTSGGHSIIISSNEP